MNISSLLWGLFFSSAGLGFFIYGKKQGVPVPLACGLALMVLPYLVSNLVLLVILGLGLLVVPYYYRS